MFDWLRGKVRVEELPMTTALPAVQTRARTIVGAAMEHVAAFSPRRRDRVNARIKRLALDEDARLKAAEDIGRGGRWALPRQARKENTLAELTLYFALRDLPVLGADMLRQAVVIAPKRTDFFFPTPRLIVEVDGSWHDQQFVRDEDQRHDAAAREAGCEVLRLRNGDILADPLIEAEKVARLFWARVPEHVRRAGAKAARLTAARPKE